MRRAPPLCTVRGSKKRRRKARPPPAAAAAPLPPGFASALGTIVRGAGSSARNTAAKLVVVALTATASLYDVANADASTGPTISETPSAMPSLPIAEARVASSTPASAA